MKDSISLADLKHLKAALDDQYEDRFLLQPDNTEGMELRDGLWVPEGTARIGMDYGGTLMGMPFTTRSFTIPTSWMETEKPEPTDPPELPTRTATEPFVGYRAWDVVDTGDTDTLAHKLAAHVRSVYGLYRSDKTEAGRPSGPRWILKSPSQGTQWPNPIMRAEAKPSPYDPHDGRWTERDDHCHGIYAHDAPEWKDFQPNGWGAWTTFNGGIHPRAMGRVELTGRVVVHEKGYRAEAARIVALCLSPRLLDEDGVVEALEERYACDVTFDPREIVED